MNRRSDRNVNIFSAKMICVKCENDKELRLFSIKSVCYCCRRRFFISFFFCVNVHNFDSKKQQKSIKQRISRFESWNADLLTHKRKRQETAATTKIRMESPKKMDPFMMPDIRLLCCQTALALFTYRFTSLHRCRGCPMPFVYFNLLRLSNDLHCCIFVLRPSKALRQFVAIYRFIVSFSFGILSGPVKDTHIYFLCWVNIWQLDRKSRIKRTILSWKVSI